MRVLLLLLALPLGVQAEGWADAFRPVKTVPAGLREEPDAPAPLQVIHPKAKAIPVREVRAPASFPVRSTVGRGGYHAGHDCPACGHVSHETHVVRGWVGNGQHRHACPRCGSTWVH